MTLCYLSLDWSMHYLLGLMPSDVQNLIQVDQYIPRSGRLRAHLHSRGSELSQATDGHRVDLRVSHEDSSTRGVVAGDNLP